MRPSDVLDVHRDSVLSIVAGMGMSNLRVFGSVLHGDDSDGSDIDLLVDVPAGATLVDMVALQRAIEMEIGLPVDVLTADDLPERFRSMVLAEARPL